MSGVLSSKHPHKRVYGHERVSNVRLCDCHASDSAGFCFLDSGRM